MSKHHRNQQPWVAPRPEKVVTPSSAPPALTKQEPETAEATEPAPVIAFSPPPMDDLPPDTSYFGVAGAVPETKLPLKHDRLTKGGATYIVVGVNEQEMQLMGPKGVETVATAKLGDYTR